MFTLIALGLVGLLTWRAERQGLHDRQAYRDLVSDEARLSTLALHARQELKLIAFLLAGVVVMLGVVADRTAY